MASLRRYIILLKIYFGSILQSSQPWRVNKDKALRLVENNRRALKSVNLSALPSSDLKDLCLISTWQDDVWKWRIKECHLFGLNETFWRKLIKMSVTVCKLFLCSAYLSSLSSEETSSFNTHSVSVTVTHTVSIRSIFLGGRSWCMYRHIFMMWEWSQTEQEMYLL